MIGVCAVLYKLCVVMLFVFHFSLLVESYFFIFFVAAPFLWCMCGIIQGIEQKCIFIFA
jgi:hypothetical protein